MNRSVADMTPSIGDDDLVAELTRTLELEGGAAPEVVRLERRPSLYRTSFALEEVDVELADGTILELMLKDLSPAALHETARRAKPTFLYAPRREIETYRTILTPERLDTAALYGARVDEEQQRFWLLLERVPGIELYQTGDLEVWQEAARWLARMHAHFSQPEHPIFESGPVGLVRYDEEFYRTWIHRACAFAEERYGSRLSLEWLAKRYDRVVERLLALPSTLVHGEFYASNVLVQEREDGGVRVCPIDWETAGVGPGLIDLAALVAGRWTDDQRQAITRAYFDALEALDPSFVPTEEFRIGLVCCRIHLAVQWLGWSADWSPPAEHAQDWLREALGLAEIVGIS